MEAGVWNRNNGPQAAAQGLSLLANLRCLLFRAQPEGEGKAQVWSGKLGFPPLGHLYRDRVFSRVSTRG